MPPDSEIETGEIYRPISAVISEIMRDVPEEELKEMKEDDVALMNFAFKYIKFLMMMENTLKPNAEVLQAKIKEMEEAQAAKDKEKAGTAESEGPEEK